METGLRRHHIAGFVLLLFITNCQMSPLPSNQDGDQSAEESVHKMRTLEAAPSEDQASAASDHGHLARVQIKVYRGPDDHHHHAPYGYWVKQPADDAPHHH